MFLLFSALTLFLAVAVMVVLRLFRAAPRLHWSVAVGGVLIAWPLALLARLQLPGQFSPWHVDAAPLWVESPLLVFDQLSWSLAVAIVTLVAAVILTVVARPDAINWRAWAGSLVLGGVGMLAVASGNVFTMLLLWAALDLVELAILLTQIRPAGSNSAIIALAGRMGGIVLLLLAEIQVRSQGQALVLVALPSELGVYLLLAATLRLGIFPLHLPVFDEPPMRRGLGTSLRLIPAAASLVLLARSATLGVPAAWADGLAALAGFSALYGAARWAAASDELNGRPFWVLSAASLASAAAILGQPAACLGWGLVCVLCGGLIFLYSARARALVAFPLAGVLGFSALPFTPLWPATTLYAARPGALSALLLSAVALLLVGYLRHALRPGEAIDPTHRWIWIVYPLGLALLPAALIFVQAPEFWQMGTPVTLAGWSGAASLGLAALLGIGSRYGLRLPGGWGAALGSAFSLRWLYQSIWLTYRLLERLLALISHLLEGEGGLLWVLVLLAAAISLLLGGPAR